MLVRPSVVMQRAIDLQFCTQSCIIHTLVGIENGLYRSPGYGTFHKNQTSIPGSWAHRKSDWQQI